MVYTTYITLIAGAYHCYILRVLRIKDDISIKYGTFNEFHKEYFITNSCILGQMPNYYISFLTQFIAISVVEGKQLSRILLNRDLLEVDFSEKLS